MISIHARRELAASVARRYAAAGRLQRTRILDEFVATTGYARKYAIQLLGETSGTTAGPIRRRRPRWYGDAVQGALVIAWAAANCICAKRLVPFLPDLIPTLERHGHLTLTDDTRTKLVAISAATADRLLEEVRQGERRRRISTTRAGALLKHQVPVRTFADWEDAVPGFMEADLVAHCGSDGGGSFLQTLVLTDVTTGWTECLALLYRSEQEVLQALGTARALLPFPLLGIDTDNGSEFLNLGMLDYCAAEAITFTRCRPYKKNDQCRVEQKNGTIVRQLVGYDRYEGVAAWRCMGELYQRLRLYVNFFQPSMKLVSKSREGAKVSRHYDAAQTPYQRLLAAGILAPETAAQLEALYANLDPVALLREVEGRQDALWEHAREKPVPRMPRRVVPKAATSTAHNGSSARGPVPAPLPSGPASTVPAEAAVTIERQKRRYRRSGKPRVPHTWRTRKDPFEAVTGELKTWLRAEPDATAKSLFLELQRRYPDQFPDGQLRGLQRRVKEWRGEIMRELHEEWLRTDSVLAARRAEGTPTASAA